MSTCSKCHRDGPTGALFCAFCGASIVPGSAAGEQDDAHIGQTFKGMYLVERRIAAGAMGQVYRAMHLTLDVPVALKILRRSLQADPSFVQRFHREARAASRLRHPNVISVTDFGQADDGAFYMVMEFVAGRSLARVIADEQPLPEQRVVRIGAQILAALAEAHASQILHRDLKPENVMVEALRSEPDSVKVVDFGIAKTLGPADGVAGALTEAGVVCGTPGYMSPEQWSGEVLDARSDLYAAGVILYQMLCGRLPYEATTPHELVRKHLTESPPPPSRLRPITPELDALVMRAISPAAADRFQTAEAMREALLSCPVRAAAEPAPVAPVPTVVLPAEHPVPALTEPLPRRGEAPGPGHAPEGGGPADTPRRQERAGAASGRTAGPGDEPGKAPAVGWQGLLRSRPAIAGAALGLAVVALLLALALRGPGEPPPPAIAAIAPTSGSVEGGTPVLVRGSGFVAGTTVSFGGLPAAVASQSESVLWVRTPARQAGAVDVVVTAPGGQRAVMPGAYLFAVPPPPPPVLGAVEPAGCPPAGGLEVTLTGSGFGAGAEVQFGGAAARVVREEPGALRVICPAHEPGAAAVRVVNPDGAAAELAGAFTYEPPASAPAAVARPPPRPSGAARPAVAGARGGILEVRDTLHALPTPPEASGEGILSVQAEPFGEVYVEGQRQGGAPRELRVKAGSYRIRIEHPSFGHRETVLKVAAGARARWTADFLARR